jgi:hypothetical protein
MADKLATFVKETTTSTGTGTIDLNGAVDNRQAFGQALSSGDQTTYAIYDDPANPTLYEIGRGTFTSGTPNTLSRDTVYVSSNGGSKISLQSGTTYTVIGTIAPDADGKLSADFIGGGIAEGDVQIHGAAGSVSSTTFGRDGDKNTGMYFPATDAIGFATNGSRSVQIKAGGIVLSGSGRAYRQIDNGGTERDLLSIDGSNITHVAEGAPGDTAFYSHQTEVFRGDSNQNIIVGATSVSNPKRSITIVGSSLPGVAIRNTSANVARTIDVNTGGTLFFRNGDQSAPLIIENNATGKMIEIRDGYARFSASNDTPAQSGNPGASISDGGQVNAAVDGGASGIFGRNGSTGDILLFYDDGSSVGSVSTDGSSVSYNTSSDRRLKRQDQPLSDVAARVKATRWVSFVWDGTGRYGEGVIAQEAADLWPTAISPPSEDTSWWQADYSAMVPAIGAALADALQRLDAIDGGGR